MCIRSLISILELPMHKQLTKYHQVKHCCFWRRHEHTFRFIFLVFKLIMDQSLVRISVKESMRCIDTLVSGNLMTMHILNDLIEPYKMNVWTTPLLMFKQWTTHWRNTWSIITIIAITSVWNFAHHRVCSSEYKVWERERPSPQNPLKLVLFLNGIPFYPW